MLLKLSYILLGYMLVNGFFLRAYGAHVSIAFNLTQYDRCVITSKGTDVINNKFVIYKDDSLQLRFTSKYYMNLIRCFVTSSKNPTTNTVILNLYDPKSYSNGGNPNEVYVYNHGYNATKDYEGSWFCRVLTLKDNPNIDKVVFENHTYNEQKCYLNVTILDKTLPLNEPEEVSGIPKLWIYVAIGTLVATIIIAQTVVILYLKIKAKRNARLESISLRTPVRGDTDKKRYSQPPGAKKSRFSRMLRMSNRHDETIYETLEELRSAVNGLLNSGVTFDRRHYRHRSRHGFVILAQQGDSTPPVPPIENIPTLKKKESSQKQESPGVASTSLPRPEKIRPAVPLPATLHRIPEREKSPELDISKRPPLPLPTELPDEDSGTLSRARKPFRGNEEGGHSTNSTLSRQRPGTASVASELNSILQMRKASMATPLSKKPVPVPPKKYSFSALGRKPIKEVASNLDSSENRFFVPEVPSPLPTGKSAILLGLAPGPTPKPKPKMSSTNPLPNPPKPIINQPKMPVATIPPTAAMPKPGAVMLPRPALTPNLTPALAKPTAPFHQTSPVTPKSVPPIAKPIVPFVTKPPKQVAAVKPQIPDQDRSTVAPIPQHVGLKKPVPNFPQTKGKPSSLPSLPRTAPIQEAVYQETEEPFYNDDFSEPEPSPPSIKKQKPLPQPPNAGRPPPLPPPNRPTQEDVYEEYSEDQIYNSDEEWTYEPLKQYNIYSS